VPVLFTGSASDGLASSCANDLAIPCSDKCGPLEDVESLTVVVHVPIGAGARKEAGERCGEYAGFPAKRPSGMAIVSEPVAGFLPFGPGT
jgi:hypothetical protein